MNDDAKVMMDFFRLDWILFVTAVCDVLFFREDLCAHHLLITNKQGLIMKMSFCPLNKYMNDFLILPIRSYESRQDQEIHTIKMARFDP